jgi:hypothetical protein
MKMMKYDKKWTPFYRFNPNRSRPFGVWTILRRLLRWRRYPISPLKKPEKPATFPHRIVDAVIWIAGLSVLIIALSEIQK